MNGDMNWGGQFSNCFKLQDLVYKQEWKTKMREVHRQILSEPFCKKCQRIIIPIYYNEFSCNWCDRADHIVRLKMFSSAYLTTENS